MKVRSVPSLLNGCHWGIYGAISCFLVAGASAAEFRVEKSGYGQQETIKAIWQRTVAEPVSVGDWIGLYLPDQMPSTNSPSLKWLYLGGDTAMPSLPVRSGSVDFVQPGLPVGDYVARFFANDSYEEIAPAAPFTVIFGLDKLSYGMGENITAIWKRAPDTPRAARDWIGIYRPNQTPGGPASLLWAYLNGSRTAPSAAVEEGSLTFVAPSLPPGDYVARFFRNDGYTQLCEGVPFTITGPGGPTPPVFVGSPNALRDPVAGVAYTGCVRGYVRDPDLGEQFSFTKISGPAWLSVSPTGELSGTPALSDVGAAELVVAAEDLMGNSAQGTFYFSVRQPGQEQVTSWKMMSYNLYHGWGMFNQGERKGFDTIALSRADIICTAESTNNASGGSGNFQPREVARELGWYYAGTSGDRGVISRWPVVETFVVPDSPALGARIRLSENPLQEVIVYSVHFDYRYYGPYEAQKFGSTNESVLVEEQRSKRPAEAQAVVDSLQAYLPYADTTPVFVVGDFNCPSHLDWVPAAAHLHYGKVVEWPATRIMEDAGLMDSFRVAHPDPVAVPGITWSPVYGEPEPQDRIDFIFFKGSQLEVVSSETFNPVVEVQAVNGSLEPAKDNTWPSDHAAVITHFQLRERPLASWRQAHFGTQANNSEVAGNEADPDGDGWCNLFEYAMGTDPLQANAATTSMIEGDRLALEFSYNMAATDVVLVPEWSVDLQTWSREDIDIELVREEGGLRWLRAKLPVRTAGPVFARLRVIDDQ